MGVRDGRRRGGTEGLEGWRLLGNFSSLGLREMGWGLCFTEMGEGGEEFEGW